MLKSLRKGSDFIDEFVAIDESLAEHSKNIKDELHSVLSGVESNKLKLAALAQVVDEFLHEKRRADSRVSDSTVDLKVTGEEA